MNHGKPLLSDGSTFQDAIRACGSQYADSDPDLVTTGRTLAKWSVAQLFAAFAHVAHDRYASWGADIPDHTSFGAQLKWSRNPFLFGATRVAQLVEFCRREVVASGDDLEHRMFWEHGCDLVFHTPDLISPCRNCRRLFFHSDSRRVTCNDCQRKAEREKKRNQRGTDLSERTCPVCSIRFTPKRSHAVCCSPRCRAALSRKKAAKK